MKKIFAALICVCLIYLIFPSVAELNNVYAQQECDEVGEPCCYDPDADYRYCAGSLTCDEALSPFQCVPAAFSCQTYCASIDCQGSSCIECPASGEGDCECSNCAVEESPEEGETGLFCSNGELNTAIGCIPIENSDELIGFILGWAIGVGGGIAFLLIIFAGFQLMTSSGNPERLKAGQELMTSAIAGLILLIFSVFILEIIGIDILGLPGFGK